MGRPTAEELAGPHLECEDGWYSCPLCEEGCIDDRQSGCTCGRNMRVEAIGAALRAAESAAFEAAAEACEAVHHPHVDSWGKPDTRARFYQKYILASWQHCANACAAAIRVLGKRDDGGGAG